MFAVALLTTLILLNFWFNGYKYPYRVWLVYLSFALFLATGGNGSPDDFRAFLTALYKIYQNKNYLSVVKFKSCHDRLS